MPQMSPLMWDSLFLYFSILALIISLKLFFKKHAHQTASNEFNQKSKMNNWKW